MKRLGPVLGVLACCAFGTPRVAYGVERALVLVIGESDAAADLQHAITTKLREDGFEVFAALDVEDLVELAPPDPEAERLKRVIAQALEKAKQRYRVGELLDLRHQLDTIDSALKEYPAAGALARDYYVLRTALLLDDNKSESAREFAAQALHYDLATEPDSKLYPAAVRALIEREKDRLIAAQVLINDAPANSQFFFNGVRMELPAALAPGRHEVEVHAKGYQTRSVAFDLLPAQELSLSVPLAFRLRRRFRDDIEVFLTKRELTEALRAKLRGDASVFSSRDQAAVVQVARGGFAHGEANAGWAAGTARDALRGTGVFLGGGAVDAGWRWGVDAATGWGIRRQAVRFRPGHTFGRYHSNGPAAQVSVHARNRIGPGDAAVDVEVEVRWSPIDGARVVEQFTGEQWVLDGGTTTTVRLAGAYQLRRWANVWPMFGVLGLGESNVTQSGPDGSLDIGVTTSYTRVSAGARTGATIPLARSGELYTMVDAVIFSVGAENDDVRLGDEIDTIREVRIWAGTRWAVGAWDVAVESSASYARMGFAGPGSSALFPRPNNAKREIEDYVFTARIGRRF